MVSETFGRLVFALKNNPKEYCLFLGAGASIDSGAKDANTIAYAILKEIYEAMSSLSLTNQREKRKFDEWAKERRSFSKILEEFAGNRSRRDIIAKYVTKATPSTGYKKLALLVKNGFFRGAFTTNFDNLLEKALQSQGLVINSDFEVLVLGKDDEKVIDSKIRDFLRNRNQAFLVLKLHGDLHYPSTLRVTESETRRFSTKLSRCLSDCLNELGFIFVGYGGRDPDVLKVLGKIRQVSYPHWWVSKRKVTNNDVLEFLRRTGSQNNILWEDEFGPGVFDDLFIGLHKVLLGPSLSDFLEQIGKPQSEWYSRIDRLFVQPKEFEDILRVLEKHKIVFLVGDPEIGKTYTAVRLLWEYYLRGYKPKWHFGAEPPQRMEVRQSIVDLSEIENLSINYFEDPFGKVSFEDHEDLRRQIGNLFAKVKDINVRVIITSREEVFKEFQDRILSQSDLQKIAIQMTLKSSYDSSKKEDMLTKWAKAFDCKWLERDQLKRSIIEEASGKLQTPLSIRDFAFASKQCVDLSELMSLMASKSKETPRAFAEEIKHMEKEKVLFLLVVFVLQRLEPGVVEDVYTRLCKKLGLNLEANSFSHLKHWFRNKVVPHREWRGFEFTHPSYIEGIVASLAVRKVTNFALTVFSHLLEETNPFVRGFVGFTLVGHFGEIASMGKMRRLIDRTLKDKKVRTRIGPATAIRKNFAKLPEQLSQRYLMIMMGDTNRFVRKRAIYTIDDNFNKISENERLEFLYKGMDDRAADVRLATASCIDRHVGELPVDLIQKALDHEKELREYSGWDVRDYAHIVYNVLRERIDEMRTQQIVTALKNIDHLDLYHSYAEWLRRCIIELEPLKGLRGWSRDIRELIQMLYDMLKDSDAPKEKMDAIEEQVTLNKLKMTDV